jgi:hypothetical protein
LPHRTFTDAQGTEWQVWDVSPHALEEDRRSGDDRRTPPPGERDPERRAPDERRAGEERRHRPRLVVRTDLTKGWLVFERVGEKRRLIPIPAGWQTLSEQELDGLRQQATVVRTRTS